MTINNFESVIKYLIKKYKKIVMKKLLLSLGTLFILASAYSQTYITLYTKCGKSVQGLVITELSASEITAYNAAATTEFPNATLLANSSSTYNCHSYAWNITNGGQKCWINATNSIGSNNIQNYWLRDYYTSTTASNAQKIYYYASDHSAVVSSIAGMYESKWGTWPLMRHAPGYGPYSNMDERAYYSHNTVSGILGCSNGTGTTSVGVNSTYFVTSLSNIPEGNYVQEVWTVTDAKGDDTIGIRANVSISGTCATISFNRRGIYEIHYDLYLTTGEYLGNNCFEAVVDP
jgi:hypothetical protein